jgi:hypothetical protein
MSHRLLRTDLKRREGKTVAQLAVLCKEYADRIVPGNDYDPYRPFSMKLARWIDSTWITRQLFLIFKKFYPKPVYS